MTAQLLNFPQRALPVTEEYRARHLDNARAVIASAEFQDDQTLRDACLVMQAWGGTDDWIIADAMMLAIRTGRRPKPDYRSQVLPTLFFCAAAFLFLTLFLGATP